MDKKRVDDHYVAAWNSFEDDLSLNPKVRDARALKAQLQHMNTWPWEVSNKYYRGVPEKPKNSEEVRSEQRGDVLRAIRELAGRQGGLDGHEISSYGVHFPDRKTKPWGDYGDEELRRVLGRLQRSSAVRVRNFGENKGEFLEGGPRISWREFCDQIDSRRIPLEDMKPKGINLLTEIRMRGVEQIDSI